MLRWQVSMDPCWSRSRRRKLHYQPTRGRKTACRILSGRLTPQPMRAAEKLQRFARTPFLDVLNAQASFSDAQANSSAARASVVDRQIDLFLALRGGWEVDS